MDHSMPFLSWQWSTHAKERLQQRGIARPMVNLLLDWGTQQHVGHGCQRVIFAKRNLKQLKRRLPKPQCLALEKSSRLFAVIDGNGVVVTVGHLNGHLRRH